MGWPAGGFRPRVLYVAHHNGVACAIGHGCCDRSSPTRKLILDGLQSVATTQGLPNFRAVRICMHDAHCNDCSLAFGVFSTQGPERACVERPFPFMSMLSVDAAAASYNASPPAPAQLQRCGWIGGITDWRGDGAHPPGLMVNGSTRARLINVSLSPENLARRGVVEAVVPRGTSPCEVGTCELGTPGRPFNGPLHGVRVPRHERLSYAQQAERWACLIDVRGTGFSQRVPHLLCMAGVRDGSCDVRPAHPPVPTSPELAHAHSTRRTRRTTAPLHTPHRCTANAHAGTRGDRCCTWRARACRPSWKTVPPSPRR